MAAVGCPSLLQHCPHYPHSPPWAAPIQPLLQHCHRSLHPTPVPHPPTHLQPHLLHPRRFLEPEYRRPLVLQELLGFNADVVCLQEVDEKAFSAYLAPQLAVEGGSGPVGGWVGGRCSAAQWVSAMPRQPHDAPGACRPQPGRPPCSCLSLPLI